MKDLSCYFGHHRLTEVCVCVAVRRLLLCEELDRSSCGSVLFHGYLPPPGKDEKQSLSEYVLKIQYTS